MFTYRRTADPKQARDLLAQHDAQPLGGGTDLLVAIHEGIEHPRVLVDVRAIAGASDLVWGGDGSLRIGAAVRVATLATDPRVQRDFPALAQAAGAVGTPALRNMGTIGGNLCQRPRCWYLRGAVPCLKNGGDSCPAEHGENQYHAILGGGPCFIVHPSDPAVALSALDATVHATGPNGDRAIPIAQFFVLPSERMDRETVLESGEYVTHVDVPAASAGGRQLYEKIMQRGAWDFALVSIAAAKRRDGAVRLVLGGVAPRPWAVNPSVEEDVASGRLSDDDIDTLAERAMYDAKPLEKNAYKVQLAKVLLKRAMREL